MRPFLFLFFCLIILKPGSTQVTWSENIAPILYNNCVTCHRPEGIAPFSLITYYEASIKAGEIEAAVLTGEMPPWPADPNYAHFADELVLTADEKFKISQWIANDLAEGDPELAPEPPVFNFGTSVLDAVDTSFTIGNYTTQYAIDEYRHFVVRTNFAETKYFNVMEIIPGNWNLVHHVDVYLDSTDISYELDLADPLPGFNEETGFPVSSKYVGGWSPGSGPLFLPPDWGIEIPVGSDIVIQIHYAPDNLGSTDSTRINFKFVENVEDVRHVEVSIPLYNPLGEALIIPANEITNFTQQSIAMGSDKSFIAIMPHMHKLGRSYKIWIKTLDGDSLPIIDIPNWDFHWQYFYTFPTVQKIPEGAKFYANVYFDNTTDNPDNPNDPPITVYEGPYTSDEMLMTFMAYTNYEEGDEYIIIDSSFLFPAPIIEIENESVFKVYPNPASTNITIESDINTRISGIQIIDIYGKEIMHWENLSNVKQEPFSTSIEVSTYPKGIYFIQLKTAEHNFVKKVILF